MNILYRSFFCQIVKFLIYFQGVVIEPKLPSHVTIRTRKVVPITSAWTSRKSTQQGCIDVVRVWRAFRDEQAADVYVGQLTRYVERFYLLTEKNC